MVTMQTRRHILLGGLALSLAPAGATRAEPDHSFAERADALVQPYARAGIFAGR